MIDQGHKKFVELLEDICGRYADKTAITYMRNDDSKTLFTFGELFKHISAVKEKIVDAGLRSGDRAAVIAPHSPFAIITGLALPYTGITTVPIDAALPIEEINRLLGNADVRAVFTLSEINDDLDKALIMDIPVFNISTIAENLVVFKCSIATVKKNSTIDPHIDVIAMLYSSGTTATVKGVMITYSSILLMIPMWEHWSKFTNKSRLLSVFPYNHIAGYACLMGYILNHVEIGLIEDMEPSKLAKGLLLYAPTHFAMVPRVYEIIEQKIKQSIKAKGFAIEAVLSMLMGYVKFSRKVLGINKEGTSLLKSVTRQVFGQNIFALISGAAPCKASTADYYLKLGFGWSNTYATTETGVPIAGTGALDRYPVDTVGHVEHFSGIEIKIHAPDENGIGEIRVKTVLIMKGYFRDPELTAAAFDEDGYFKTGDLGYIDKKGYLHVTGRIKEAIMLHTGKKIAPNDVDVLYSSLCPDIMIASCGVSNKDESYDVIHLFVESGNLSDKDQQEIEKRIMEFSAETSTLYQVAGLHFIDKLPTTSVGKVKRFVLKEMVVSGNTQNK